MYCDLWNYVYIFTQCIDEFCCWQGNSAGGECCVGCDWSVYAWLRSLHVHRLRAHYFFCRSNASDTSQPAPMGHSGAQTRISLVSRLPNRQFPSAAQVVMIFTRPLSWSGCAHRAPADLSSCFTGSYMHLEVLACSYS